MTGTRLPGGFTSPTPLATVSAAAIAQRAPAAIIESLYDLPAFKQDAGVTGSPRGPSANAAPNLRGLGAVRTLTLVNGMRQVGTNTQLFDTNRIPTNLVERVDVVTGGASAAYGSDAVGGVVNFVLNDQLEGIRANAQYGITQVGDNEGFTVGLAFGTGFQGGRGHFIFATEYADANGTGNIYSRDFGRKEPGLVSPSAAQRAAQGLPANIYINGVEFLATGTPGGIITSGPAGFAGTAFRADGTPYAFPVGTQYGAPASGLALSNLMVGSTANYGQTTLGTFYIAQPLQRSATMARVTYDLTDSVAAFADYSYTYNFGEGITGNQQIPNGIMSSFVVQASNPFIPAATRAEMTRLGLTQFSMGYVPVAAVGDGRGHSGYKINEEIYTLQTNVGLRGSLGERWKWDTSWSYGWYHNIAARGVNNIQNANFAAATYVVTGANGQPACGPLATNPNLNATTRLLVDAGCVPYNPFGMNPSQAAIDYVVVATRNSIRNRQSSFAVNLSGSPIDLWAGPLAVAAGAEYRKDELTTGSEGIDPRALANGGSTPYQGKRDVKEAYLEVGLPLLRDLAFAQALDLNAAVRRTSYELSGTVTTAKLGVTWDVIDGVRLRATQSRDIRAPNLTELFQLGAQINNQGIRNPFNGQVGALITRTSGNPDLTPEVAQTFTGGIVLRPTWAWASRFTLTADYYWIKLKGVIASVSAQDTLNRCFAGIQTYCDAVSRDNSGYGIAFVNLRAYNLNQLRAKGVDIELGYRVPIEDFNVGDLKIRAIGGYQPTLTTIDSAGVAVNAAGTALGVPEWRWVVNFDYSIGKLGAQLQATYTNQILSNPNFIGPDDPRYESIKTTAANTVNKNLFPAVVYWNMSAQYQINHNFQVYGAITNLMNKQPPELAMIAFTGSVGQWNPYDPVGRAFRVGVRANF